MSDGNRRPISICAVEETDVDIARIIGRRLEIPADLPVVPVIGVHIAGGDAVQKIVTQRRLCLVKMIWIVAAPGVFVLATVRNDEIELRASELVWNPPEAAAAERLVLIAIVRALAVASHRNVHPPAAVQSVVPHTDIGGVRPSGGDGSRQCKGVVAWIVLDVERNEVLRVDVGLRHTASAIRTAKRTKPRGVSCVNLGGGCSARDCEWNRIAGHATHDRSHVVGADSQVRNRNGNGVDGPRGHGGRCRAEVNYARSLRFSKGRSYARHDGECTASDSGSRANPGDLH